MYPKYAEIKLPLLVELKRRGGRSRPADKDNLGLTVYDRPADYFNLSEEDRNGEMWNKSLGRFQPKWHNMVRFARNDCVKAGFISSLGYGIWGLTEKAYEILDTEWVESSGRGISTEININPEDFRRRQEEAGRVGSLGEEFVLDIERAFLINAGREDLADQIEHVSSRNIAAGYDILSFDSEGQPKYIEVKTTRLKFAPFEWTENERKIAERLGSKYWIYRVTQVGERNPRIEKIRDPVELVTRGLLTLKPTSYKVSINEPQIM